MTITRHGGGRALVALVLAVGGAWACAPRARAPRPPVAVPALSRPDGCRVVAAGEALQAAVDAAPAGAALCLAEGVHDGPLRLERAITVWGPRGAVVRSRGGGTTIRVTGQGVTLSGFTVDGSGGRYDLQDAAVNLTGAGHVVDGLTVVNATFGILADRATRVSVRGNHVRGDATTTFGLRGDPIRLWETSDSVVENNLVEDGRDVVVWYSSRNRLAGNRVLRGRYGTHLMYSHDNVVVGNELLGGVVGVFVMYSRNVTLERNVIAGAGGAAGIGVGLKDAGNVTMRGNRLIADAAGLYIDGSPSQLDEHVRVERNEFRLCDAAVVFHSSGTRNHFIGNHFADNQVQVRAEGNAEARAAEWRGNTWDDYAGYDLDGDGTGDVAYELRSVSGALVARYPELAFFHGSPTLGLADAAARLVPLRAPPLLAVDAAPRVAWEGIDDAD